MAEATQDKATPPATSGGLTKEDLASAISQAIKPFQDKITSLETNLNTVANELAARKADETAKGEKEKPGVLTAESVAKLVTDAIAADRASQQETNSKAASKKALKDKIAAAKLGGDQDLAAFLPDTDDEAQLTAAAEKLATKVTPKAKLPGVIADGGNPAARNPVDYSKLNSSQKVEMGINQLIAQNAGGVAQ